MCDVVGDYFFYHRELVKTNTRIVQEGDKMKKKLLTGLTVMALAISTIGGTVFAAEPEATLEITSLDELEAGTYELPEASLTCYYPMMGIDYAGILKSAELTVKEDGSAEVTLYVGTGKGSFTTTNDEGVEETVEFDTFIKAGGSYNLMGTVYELETAYQDKTEWKDVTFTGTQATDDDGYTYTVVDTITFPITSVEGGYNLALYATGYPVGYQFGYRVKAGAIQERTAAVFNAGWSNVKDDSTTTPTDVKEAEGVYAVDISWSGMPMSPILEIDEENNTFKLYWATNPSAMKGSGTITEQGDGVYTLNYTDETNAGKTVDYTYDAETDTITFTTALYFGSSSFDNVKCGVESYTATLYKADTNSDDNGGAGTADGNTNNNDTTTHDTTTGGSPQTGDTTSSTWMIVICMAAVAAVGVAARKRAVA